LIWKSIDMQRLPILGLTLQWLTDIQQIWQLLWFIPRRTNIIASSIIHLEYLVFTIYQTEKKWRRLFCFKSEIMIFLFTKLTMQARFYISSAERPLNYPSPCCVTCFKFELISFTRLVAHVLIHVIFYTQLTTMIHL
jgi:hypothetical protein